MSEAHPAPHYVILINGSSTVPSTGQSWAAVAEQGGWSITQSFGRQATTLNITLYDERATPTATFVPQALQTISITDTTINQVIFSGIITKPTFKSISPNVTEWQLDCTDYSYYADAAICLGDFSYQTADQMVKTLTASAGSGIKTNGFDANGPFVQSGPKIPRYRAEYIPLSDAWTAIAKLAAGVGSGKGSNLGGVDWGWRVDENLFLHFYAMQNAPASAVTFVDDVGLLPGNPPYPTAAVGMMKGGNLHYEFDGQNLRDSVIVWGGNVIGTKTDVFQGNGVQSQWPLTFQILNNNPRLKLTINGIRYTAGIATADPTAPASSQRFQFFVSQNANGQWFMQTGKNLVGGNQLPPSAGTTIVLQYNFQAPVIARVDDLPEERTLGGAVTSSSANTTFTSSISMTDTSASWATNQFAGMRVSTGAFTAAVVSNTSNVLTTTPWYPSTPSNGSVVVIGWSPNNGVFQAAIKDKSILDIGSAQVRANQELNLYSKLQERVTFDTIENWPGHIKAGDTFKLTSLFIPDSQTNYTTTLSGAVFFCHTVKIAPAPAMGGWRTYNIMAQRIS